MCGAVSAGHSIGANRIGRWSVTANPTVIAGPVHLAASEGDEAGRSSTAL